MSTVTYEFKNDSRPIVSPMGYTTYDQGIEKFDPSMPKAVESITNTRVLPNNLCSGKEDSQGLKQIARTQTIKLISKWTMDDILQTNMDKGCTARQNQGMSISRFSTLFAPRQGVSLQYEWNPLKRQGNYSYRALRGRTGVLPNTEWNISNKLYG